MDGHRLPRPRDPGLRPLPPGGADGDAGAGGRAHLPGRGRAGARAGCAGRRRGHSRRAVSHPAPSGSGRVLPAQSLRLRPLATGYASPARANPGEAIRAAGSRRQPFLRPLAYGIPFGGGVDADPLYWVMGPESEVVYTGPVVVSVPSAAIVTTCTPRKPRGGCPPKA